MKGNEFGGGESQEDMLRVMVSPKENRKSVGEWSCPLEEELLWVKVWSVNCLHRAVTGLSPPV